VPAFLDTSALLKYFVEEKGADEVRRLMESGSEVWTSELTVVEGVSALAKKVRKSEIQEDNFRGFIGQLLQFLTSGRCQIVPLDDGVKQKARCILSSWALSHRIGSLDALQLASALSVKDAAGYTDFWTADSHLLNAAQAYGFTVKNPEI